MKRPVLKWKTRNRITIALALAHRFVWPILMMFVPLLFGGKNLFLWLGICLLVFALYSLIGYKLRWKHIYCSYQNSRRKEMTPDHIRWGTIKKSDVYSVPIIFGVLGVACIVCHFLFQYT